MFTSFPTIWSENTADSLLNISLDYCVKHPHVFCQYNPKHSGYELRDCLTLPVELCERMLGFCKLIQKEEDFDSLIKIFKDTSRTRLKHVDLSNSVINDAGLEVLCNHSLTYLNLVGCKRLSRNSLYSIAKLWQGLQYLNLGTNGHLFFDEQHTTKPASAAAEYPPGDHCWDPPNFIFGNAQETAPVIYEPQQPTCLELPMLRKLVVHDIAITDANSSFASLLANAQYLNFLDLSKCELHGNFNGALIQKRLTTLVLCDVLNVQGYIPAICQIKTLRHLDISNTDDSVLEFHNPNQTLKTIVMSLENLVSLDISGTNLAGNRTQEKQSLENGSGDNQRLTDIPGLASRVHRPLEFLGLLNCAHDACYRHHIPALRVSGDASEEQILVAGQAYCAREPLIQKVLNDLFQIFRFSTCCNVRLALDVVMEAMKLHLDVKHIQVSGSASLFYIVKGDYKDLFNISMRRKIIRTLIDAMFKHYDDVTMLRNGCLTLLHFKIPDDVFFDYERLASLLLLIVAQDDQDEFVQRIGVYLLNSLACQVDGIEKKLVGDYGAINIMLKVIERRLQRDVCDEVMETAWSTMWNVTDETPINCARFLDGKGMELFLGCLEAFPQKPELLRNMMGLLGNVAEVKELRTHLMQDDYLVVFSDLLDSKSDGIEVSYNAAGILSHIASDGPELWNAQNITAVRREDVLAQMLAAIDNWSLNTKRNINYRSFRPILRLLLVEHTPEAQYWAVWALTNLTTVYPEKYCLLLRDEGGIHYLKTLLQKPALLHQVERIQQLAVITIQNCHRYETYRNLEFSSDEDEEAFRELNPF